MSLVVHAISDKDVFEQASTFMRLKLTTSLLQACKQFHDSRYIDWLYCMVSNDDVGIRASEPSVMSKTLVIPDPDRLVEILLYAVDYPGDAPSYAVHLALLLCIRLSAVDNQFWTKLSTNPSFGRVLRCLLLTDHRQAIRARSIKVIQELFNAVEQAPAGHASVSTLNGSVAAYFWIAARDLISEAADFPHQCEELFRLTYFLLARISKQAPEVVNIATLAAKVSQLLLEHTTSEVCHCGLPNVAEQSGLNL
jgi:ubiquitin carboxyl-terminal hydrolase 34